MPLRLITARGPSLRVGYTRVVLAAVSLIYMPYHPKSCTLLYGISSLLDAVDGQAARALGQSSRTGAILDMLTDRCATACLLCFLGATYPRWQLLFQFMITLDFASYVAALCSTSSCRMTGPGTC